MSVHLRHYLRNHPGRASSNNNALTNTFVSTTYCLLVVIENILKYFGRQATPLCVLADSMHKNF